MSRSAGEIASHIRTFCNPPLSLLPLIIEIEESEGHSLVEKAKEYGYEKGYDAGYYEGEQGGRTDLELEAHEALRSWASDNGLTEEETEKLLECVEA